MQQEDVDAGVKELLDLKGQYKSLTGEDLAGGGGKGNKGKKAAAAADKAKQEEANKKKQQQHKEETATGDGATRDMKKITRLGLEVKKEDSLADWYSQVRQRPSSNV